MQTKQVIYYKKHWGTDIMAIKDLIATIEKRFGKEAISGNHVAVDCIHSGSYSLDAVLGGGYPKGRIVEVFGGESCLDGRTRVKVKYVHRGDNVVIGYYNKLLRVLHGCFCDQRRNFDIYIMGIEEVFGEIKWHPVEDVIYVGKRPIYELVTKKGHVITATDDHKFYVGDGQYKELKEFTKGNPLFVYKHDTKLRLKYIEVDRVESIEPVGDGKVYDVKCGGKWHNFIADDFVVHNCGKTTAALHLVAEVQKTGKAVGYVDVEQALDPFYAEKLGVDMSADKFILSQPDSAEEALEIIRTMCEEQEIGLVVLDSVAGLTPTAQAQGEAGDQKVALVARLMSSQLNILKNIIKRNNNILLCINQTRDTIGGFGFGGNSTKTPGGQALKFYASQRLEFSRIGSEKDGDEITGNLTRVKVKKNKIAPPFKKCEFVIRFGKGIDKVQEIIDLGLDYGILKKKGAFFYYGDQRIGQGEKNTRKFLEEDESLRIEIGEAVIKKAKEELNKEPDKNTEENENN